MDIYAEIEEKVYNLRQEIISSIKKVLHEKGYEVGDTATHPCEGIKFNIEYDRLLINNYHTDNISTDNLVGYLRSAIHVLPKNL